MAILDKVLGVGEAVRDKFKETFGEPDTSSLDDGEDASGEGEHGAQTAQGEPLDVAGAYAALGLAEGATLAEVRDAYRAFAKYHHPIAVSAGDKRDDTDAQKALDRLLEALELLEEALVPLSGLPAGAKAPPPPPKPTRKRATARKS